MKNPVTQERLKELLDYNPETGVFTWIGRGRGIRTGRRAGSFNNKLGYRVVVLDGKDYYEHRLAWFYMNGVWPKLTRFKNGNNKDCRIENLCEGFHLENKFNWKTKEGKSGYQKEYRAQFVEKFRFDGIKRRFGISEEEYKAMIIGQKGCCDICKQPETAMRNGKLLALAVDHNHDTGEVRGLLCGKCNTFLGKAKEDIGILTNAISYLQKHAEKVSEEEDTNIVQFRKEKNL